VRGLPPPPNDVCLIEAEWTIGSSQAVTTGWHVLAGGSWFATSLQLETMLGDFFLAAVPQLLAVLGTDVTCGALRLSTYGVTPQVIQYAPAPNVGATGTTNPVNGALVLTWRTSERSSSLLGHTWLPLTDSAPDTDHAHLKSIFWSQAQAAARSFTVAVNSIASPDGGTCVFVVLHSSRNGTPLPAAVVAPVTLGDASPLVGTMRRRVRARRPTSSPF
jgi:hypothetical protein